MTADADRFYRDWGELVLVASQRRAKMAGVRVLRVWPDRKRPRIRTVVMAAAAGEARSPGETIDLPDWGRCLVIAARPVDSPEPNLQPGELVHAYDVEVPDIR